MTRPWNSNKFYMKGEVVKHFWYDFVMNTFTKNVLIVDNDSSYNRETDCFSWSYLVMDSDGNTFWVDEDEVDDLDGV